MDTHQNQPVHHIIWNVFCLMVWNLLANGFSPSNFCCFFSLFVKRRKTLTKSVCVCAWNRFNIWIQPNSFNWKNVCRNNMCIAIYFRISLRRLQRFFLEIHRHRHTRAICKHCICIFTTIFFGLANKISLKTI